ncbi:MAG: acyloxyacyl hydrolase [Gammaproteobacteria bacterium]|nr:acyloxyacyl hydrolase [Gammaproteobacteria bacterium]
MKKLILVLIWGLNPVYLHAQESSLNLALGSFDVSHSATAMGQIEYAFATEWSGFKPHLGLFFTTDSAAYLYAGVGYPFSINNKWSLTPSLSAGYYNDGADTELGYDVEFYSQLRLEYNLENDAKIGLGFGHISNCDLGDRNPGAEIIYLNYSISL